MWESIKLLLFGHKASLGEIEHQFRRDATRLMLTGKWREVKPLYVAALTRARKHNLKDQEKVIIVMNQAYKDVIGLATGNLQNEGGYVDIFGDI